MLLQLQQYTCTVTVVPTAVLPPFFSFGGDEGYVCGYFSSPPILFFFVFSLFFLHTPPSSYTDTCSISTCSTVTTLKFSLPAFHLFLSSHVATFLIFFFSALFPFRLLVGKYFHSIYKSNFPFIITFLIWIPTYCVSYTQATYCCFQFLIIAHHTKLPPLFSLSARPKFWLTRSLISW